ncbi:MULTISPECIES: flagellar basal body rod protein FlgC [Pseudomonas]|jgi:flagellar basal-body rod protein FlgC|uniref:Flagellar basal-body rod protein FlgC n=1 Tax=Pseudomonas marincola TaxID=437900 RepID=A0A1I6Y0E6_9PSED|nr:MULTISPECIES: flagellar basal body rod protein FlgC [Pseudomonas]MBQ55556.1 flagellar basal body rod protein FlgC [Pseudomonadaceae bacterium]NRH29405.1 flagellar basal body rod protein FlgC [Pseudomonas sp. MS19]OEO26490.1 flagellar basal body rod protein FlgC [Pseudomonas sp. J237]CAE6930002.1 flagellar basal-body rod protein FlgC [Pseudomonas marincola]SFT43906.1 flagellar basal-body rod protein FlgC [Pseudomonas marincola]|tara:strand:- start:103 stop:549 length:447 start_codon:yes stop_codon:yes gene_type:complete
MSLASVFNIAGTGMSAQSTRLNTISSNIANAETVSSSLDQTYRARHPVFATVLGQQAAGGDRGSLFAEQDEAGRGVQVLGIVEDQSTLMPRYEPNHPAADKDGYVYYPNVNVVEEMADMISASRAFQTNAEMMNTAKQMLQKVLTLGQ